MSKAEGSHGHEPCPTRNMKGSPASASGVKAVRSEITVIMVVRSEIMKTYHNLHRTHMFMAAIFATAKI